MGGWISTAPTIFRRDKNLPGRFDDWMYKECWKTNNLQVNETWSKVIELYSKHEFFIKKHKILFSYFEENKEKIS